MRSRRTHLLAALPIFVLVACEPQDRQPEASVPQPAHSEKPATPNHETVDREVVWPAQSKLDRKALEALSTEAQRAVARSPVPVLVVDRSELLPSAVVIPKKSWYALSTQGDGVSVSLHANRVAHRYRGTPRVKGSERVRGQHAFVTQNEGIWSVSWTEGGVAYALEVECNERPDPRCENESFVMGLAADLSYVGGSSAEGSR